MEQSQVDDLRRWRRTHLGRNSLEVKGEHLQDLRSGFEGIHCIDLSRMFMI